MADGRCRKGSQNRSKSKSKQVLFIVESSGVELRKTIKMILTADEATNKGATLGESY